MESRRCRELLREDNEFTDVEVFILTGSYSTKDKLAMQDLNVRGHIIKPLGYGDALNVFWALQSYWTLDNRKMSAMLLSSSR